MLVFDCFDVEVGFFAESGEEPDAAKENEVGGPRGPHAGAPYVVRASELPRKREAPLTADDGQLRKYARLAPRAVRHALGAAAATTAGTDVEGALGTRGRAVLARVFSPVAPAASAAAAVHTGHAADVMLAEAAPSETRVPEYKPSLRKWSLELWSFVWLRHGTPAQGVTAAKSRAWFKGIQRDAQSAGVAGASVITAEGMRAAFRKHF